MADIKKLYTELISDYDPYFFPDTGEQLNPGQMLYNLISIKECNGIENYGNESEKKIYNRFISLIEIMEMLGIKPSL